MNNILPTSNYPKQTEQHQSNAKKSNFADITVLTLNSPVLAWNNAINL